MKHRGRHLTQAIGNRGQTGDVREGFSEEEPLEKLRMGSGCR